MKEKGGKLPSEVLYTDYDEVLRVARVRRRRSLFLRAFGLSLTVLYGLHLWAHGFLPGSQRFSTCSTKGHKGRKVPYGKNAEKLFLTVPNEESCIAASRLYATKPHIAGSEGDLQTAKDFLYLLQRELGISAPQADPIFPAGSPQSQAATLSITKARHPSAWIDEYYPVMNTPLDRALQALDEDGKVVWEADLEEHPDDTDPEAGRHGDAVPTFHGLSADGDVTGELIDANYGLKEDYDALLSKGVNFTGKIVLARYGGNFRGLKIKGAQELGAAGVLIYSDPKDDGSVTIENGYKAYPDGPARNPQSVQRGSVQYLSLYPGDPTTPGYPAYENSTRTEGVNIPKIPSLPISWANAETLKKKLNDGKGWEGKKIRLVNHVDTKVTPIWNTMGVIPGFIKDQVVIIGNHRDAWVMGAADPSSGTASMHETIRGFGALLRKGWKPLRTIVLASWDAEEYGLIGSTEWGEDFPEWIDQNVAAYLNLDGSVSGSRFSAQASPLLAHLVQNAAVDLPHPTERHRTLWDARHDEGKYFGDKDLLNNEESARIWNMTLDTQNVDELGVGVLGSGSDFTVFLQRLGVASMNHGFGATQSDAVYHYHSVYDSERWMETYGDPGFYRHVVVAKHLGLITLRVAGEPILPLNNTHYALELERYLQKVESIASTQSFDLDFSPLRHSIKSLHAASRSLDYEKLVAQRELDEAIKEIKKHVKKLRKFKRKVRKAVCRLRKKLGHPCKKHHDRDESAKINWEQHDELVGLTRYAGVEGRLRPRHPKFPGAKLREAARKIRAVNLKLKAFERGFISEGGIPEREWYKHLGVAPGKWLGYGATTLPALTEAITIEKNTTLAKYEVSRLVQAIDSIAETIKYRGQEE